MKLVEKMQESPSFVGMLRLNTKNYRVFDENFLKWMYGSDGNWKYTGAAGKDGGWVVKKAYVGPQPAMIQESMRVGQAWGQKIGMEVTQRLREKGYQQP